MTMDIEEHDKQIFRRNKHRKGPKGDLFLRGISMRVRDLFKACCARRGLPMNLVIERWMRAFIKREHQIDLRLERKRQQTVEEVSAEPPEDLTPEEEQELES
jgi:hypothetical protein